MAENAFAPVLLAKSSRRQYLTEYGLSQNQLAKAIGISPNRIAEIVNEPAADHRRQRAASQIWTCWLIGIMIS